MTASRAAFQRYIDDLIAKHGGRAYKLAEMIPMSASAFCRGVQEGTLSEENLLRLAKAVGEPPLKVLRLAGKRAVADLIEEMFGTARAPLSADDRVLVKLEPDAKRQLVRLVRGLTSK